jgi:hypothetical protein
MARAPTSGDSPQTGPLGTCRGFPRPGTVPRHAKASQGQTRHAPRRPAPRAFAAKPRSARAWRPPARPYGSRRRSGGRRLGAAVVAAGVVVIAVRRARLCGRRSGCRRARRVGARAAATGGDRNTGAAYCQDRCGGGKQSGMLGSEHGESSFRSRDCVLPRSNRDRLRGAEDGTKKLVRLRRDAGARAFARVAASPGRQLLRRRVPRPR